MEIKSERLIVDIKQEPIAGFYSMSIYPNTDNPASDTIEKVLESCTSPLKNLNEQFSEMSCAEDLYKTFVNNVAMAVDEGTTVTSISPYTYGENFDFTMFRENLTNICFFIDDLRNNFLECRLLGLDFHYNGEITPLTFIYFEALALVRKSKMWSI